MTEKVRSILDAVTARVFAYRPAEKQPKTKSPKSKDNQNDRASSI
jgi:hypothetical protein